MEHKHIFDKDGKQICCTQEEKINKIADKSLKMKAKKDSCCATDEHDNHKDEHSDHEGHDHEEEDEDHDHSGGENQSTFQLFLPAIISFVLLILGIALDNYGCN